MQPLTFPRSETARSQRCVARVISHQQVVPGYWELTLDCPFVAAYARPGQFVHVLPPYAGFDPLLRRAFSIFQVEAEAIKVLYRVGGKGTTLLSMARPDDVIDLLGPLGEPFHIEHRNIVLVGGGVGVPPLVFLAHHLLTQPSDHEPQATEDKFHVTALVGARTRYDVLGQSEFEKLNVNLQVATDDGSLGHHGLVTDLLRRHFESLSSQHVLSDTDKMSIVYSCGPWPMLRAVAHVCNEFKVPCQVSLEENMPCGIGVCNGCVVPVVQAGDDYGLFRRICVEGPVLWSHEVDWERLAGH